MILASRLSEDWGIDIPQIPLVGCAPEWMSEKAVSIGNYVVATGIDTFLGVSPQASGSTEVWDMLTGQGDNGYKQWVGANFTVETDIEKLGDLMIQRIEEKRTALGI
ncbi:MAG: carbon monoxide dehydrogenase, partial [Oscillospiraceae bacterium]